MFLLFGCYFFFNDTATTEIYTLSLHDALPILVVALVMTGGAALAETGGGEAGKPGSRVEAEPLRGVEASIPTKGLTADRKSTRLNSSHANISYAVFCLKKKKNIYHRNDLIIHT